jgi:hypothetical protein
MQLDFSEKNFHKTGHNCEISYHCNLNNPHIIKQPTMIKKSTPFIVLLFLLFITTTAISQSLQSSNLPGTGDIWAYKTITDTTMQPGQTGTGITWNFSSYFVNPTVFNQQFGVVGTTGDDSYFPTANLKVASTFGGSEYYIKTASGLQFMGYKNITGELIITNVQNYLTVPLSYGQSVTNPVVTGTSFGGFNATGTITTTADGTGTVQLQTGTYNNVLRVFYDIDLVVGADFGLDTYVHLKRYCWYRTGQRAPVLIIESLSISGNLANSYQKSVLVNTVTPTGINDLNSNITFNVSPNPATEKAVITLSENSKSVNYSVMDITGRVWKNENVSLDAANSFSLNVQQLPKGIYILTLQTADVKRQQRFIVE